MRGGKFLPWLVVFLAGLRALAGAGLAETVLYLEQQIDFSSTAGMQQKNIHRLWYDGKRLRVEIEGGKHRLVLLMAGEQIKLVFPLIRSWARYSLDDYREALSARFGRLAAGEITLEDKEEEENIGSWRCRWFVLRAPSASGSVSELCAGEVAEVPAGLYAELMERLGLDRVFGRLYEKVQALGKVPLYVKSTVTGQSEELRVEQKLLLAEKRPAPQGLFSVPEDYLEITDLPLPGVQTGGEK
jgi:hypothetical protein